FIPSRRKDGTLVFRVCIYGPPESGRKTVFKWLHGRLGKEGKIEEIEDDQGSTLFFDTEYGKTTTVKFQIYTSQSQSVLKGTDAVIFTWDSLIDRWGDNILFLKELLRFFGDKLIPAKKFDPPDVPLVVLANKSDLDDLMGIPKIREAFDTAHLNHTLIYESIATQGINLLRAFMYVGRQALLNHMKNLDRKSAEKLEKEKKAIEIIKGLPEAYKSIKISDICSRINMNLKEALKLIEDLIKNDEINALIEDEHLNFINAPVIDLELPSEPYFIEVTRGGEWVIEGDSSVFKFRVKIYNNSKFVLTDIHILLTSIPNSLICQIDRYLINRLRPNSFESPTFRLKARESCIGDVIEGLVTFYDHIGEMRTVHIKPFKIEYVCNLLVPKVISEEQFQRNISQMYEREIVLDCGSSPNELESEVSRLLSQSNFYLVESSESLNDPDLKRIKAYAEGKYDHQDVGLLVIMQKLVNRNNQLVFKAMSDNEAKITDILRDISKKCDTLKSIPEYTTELLCTNCDHKIQANDYMKMKEIIICEKCGYEIKNL
ncbi:MAG: hypothetical protein ACFFFB_21905, partial [Candidatus Heimdallarchaeota archaeon]